MCSQDNLNRLLSEVARHARQCFGDSLEAVILYGSYARGEADRESDVDIMLLVRQPAGQLCAKARHWNHFGTELDLKYHVFTSFKLQDADTFDTWKDTLPFFRNILSEGVRIGA